MSSYYTSPFELERRRLAGIVSQCESDLNAAIDEVCSQQNRMQQAAREQAAADAGYETDQQAAQQTFEKQQFVKKKQQADRKKQLQRLLDDAQLEMSVLEQQLGRMEAARQRQEQLSYRLQNAQGNLDALEQEIRSHTSKMEEEAQRAGADRNRIDYAAMSVSGTKKQKKAVSLQTAIPEQEEHPASRQKPLDLFTAKLKAVMASPCAARIPSAAALAKEFAAQPEYAKTAFAVKNMQKLTELEARVRKMEQASQKASEKREKNILEYRALCKLMQITPDEQLIRSEKGGRRIAQLCEEMKRSYLERKKHAYVAAAVEEVMSRHGIVFQDAAETAGGTVMQFTAEQTAVSVSGLERDRVVMEVSGTYAGETPTLNERRQAAQQARHFCSLLTLIEQELREDYGISFGAVTAEEPSEETIRMQKDQNRADGKHFADAKKEMSLQGGE